MYAWACLEPGHSVQAVSIAWTRAECHRSLAALMAVVTAACADRSLAHACCVGASLQEMCAFFRQRMRFFMCGVIHPFVLPGRMRAWPMVDSAAEVTAVTNVACMQSRRACGGSAGGGGAV